VRDSDATVIFAVADTLTGGSKRTAELAIRHGRPCLHLASERADTDHAHLLKDFVVDHGVKVLNVAGSLCLSCLLRTTMVWLRQTDPRGIVGVRDAVRFPRDEPRIKNDQLVVFHLPGYSRYSFGRHGSRPEDGQRLSMRQTRMVWFLALLINDWQSYINS
jgi:hypothetical protein